MLGMRKIVAYCNLYACHQVEQVEAAVDNVGNCTNVSLRVVLKINSMMSSANASS